jgi:hypothetical protein
MARGALGPQQRHSCLNRRIRTVIPGRARFGASPESITTIGGYEFWACAQEGHPGMTDQFVDGKRLRLDVVILDNSGRWPA